MKIAPVNFTNHLFFTSRPVDITKEQLQAYVDANPNDSQRDIAKHFHTTQTTISKLIRKYGIKYENKSDPTPHATSVGKDELQLHVSEYPNHTQAQIADDLHVSDSVISRLIGDYGIKYTRKSTGHPRGHVVSKEELEAFVKAHPDYKQEQIANHFNVSLSEISRLISIYDIEYTKKPTRSKK